MQRFSQRMYEKKKLNHDKNIKSTGCLDTGLKYFAFLFNNTKPMFLPNPVMLPNKI